LSRSNKKSKSVEIEQEDVLEKSNFDFAIILLAAE